MKGEGQKVPELLGYPYTSELIHSGSLHAIKLQIISSVTCFVFKNLEDVC